MAPLDPYQKAICSWLREYVGMGQCSEEWTPILDAVEAGDDRLFGIVDAYVKNAAVASDIRLSKLVGELRRQGIVGERRFAEHVLVSRGSMPPSAPEVPEAIHAKSEVPSPPNDTSTYEEPLTSVGIEKLLRRRAQAIQDPSADTAERVMASLLQGMASARHEKVGDGTALEYAQMLLSTVFARHLLRVLSPGRGELAILEPPHALHDDARFLEVMGSKLNASEEVMASWRKTPMWLPMLTTCFMEFLGRGVAPVAGTEIQQRTARIDLLRRWWHVLEAAGMHASDVGRAFFRLHRSSDEELKVTVSAELSRFDPTIRPALRGDDVSVKLLVTDIMRLHRADPGLSSDLFLMLLTPYLETMKGAEINAVLKRKRPNVSEFDRFVARNVLAWHTSEPQHLAARFTKLIQDNREYTNLQLLLYRLFAVTRGGRAKSAIPPAFAYKLHELVASGARLDGLQQVITQKFPAVAPTVASIIAAPVPQQGVDPALAATLGGATVPGATTIATVGAMTTILGKKG